MSGADLSLANLTRADLSRADLAGANLTAANLSRAKLRAADLSAARLDRASLERVDLQTANLARAVVRNADMKRANLAGANLTGAELTEVDLTGADLTGAKIEGAKITRRDLAHRCKVCGQNLQPDGACLTCQKQEIGALILGRRSRPIYLALYLALIAGPLNFIFTPLFASAASGAYSGVTALRGGLIIGAALSILALLLGLITSRHGEGRERRLFVANTFLALLNLAVLAGAAAVLLASGAKV